MPRMQCWKMSEDGNWKVRSAKREYSGKGEVWDEDRSSGP